MTRFRATWTEKTYEGFRAVETVRWNRTFDTAEQARSEVAQAALDFLLANPPVGERPLGSVAHRHENVAGHELDVHWTTMRQVGKPVEWQTAFFTFHVLRVAEV